MKTGFMEEALIQARHAAARGEVPVGAVIVHRASNKLIAACGNRVEELHDPTAHAEILAIKQACALLENTRLPEYDLYVTLEPCPMCAQAISFARINRLFFGAYDPKGGGVEHGACIFSQPTCHHRPEVIGGVRESEAGNLLVEFFKERR